MRVKAIVDKVYMEMNSTEAAMIATALEVAAAAALVRGERKLASDMEHLSVVIDTEMEAR